MARAGAQATPLLVFLNFWCPAVWWGAEGLGVSVHRLEPRQKPFMSPETGTGTQGSPLGKEKESMLELGFAAKC